MVNDVSLLARRASSNLIALGQDVGTMREIKGKRKSEGGVAGCDLRAVGRR